MLLSEENRASAGVKKENIFLFPSTKQSKKHVDGWYTISKSCEDAGIKDVVRITATGWRKRTCIQFASLELPMNIRESFYKHMGHSRGVNEAIYQGPPALQEIENVGKHLHDLDEALGSFDIPENLATTSNSVSEIDGDRNRLENRATPSNSDPEFDDNNIPVQNNAATPSNSNSVAGPPKDANLTKKSKSSMIEQQIEQQDWTPKLQRKSKTSSYLSSSSEEEEDSSDDGEIVTHRDYKLRHRFTEAKKRKFDGQESDEADSCSSDDSDEVFDPVKFKESSKQKPSSKQPKWKKAKKNDFPDYIEKQKKIWCSEYQCDSSVGASSSRGDSYSDSRKTLVSRHVWTPKRKRKLYEWFGDYVSGEKRHTFPEQSEMKRFIAEVGLEIPSEKVKTKIMNEKAMVKKRTKKRKNSLGIRE